MPTSKTSVRKAMMTRSRSKDCGTDAAHALQSPARKSWLDGLRAIAMLLVIIGHMVSGVKPYFLFTSPVKIPLFFAISGYVFNENRKSVAQFFVNLFWHLVLPWMAWAVIGVVIMLPFNGLSSLPAGLVSIVTDVALWYLPCCIIAETLWFSAHRLCAGWKAFCLAALVLFGLGLVMVKLDILNAMMINRAFIAQLYMLIGYLFRRFEDRLEGAGWLPVAGLLLAYIAMGIISAALWPGKSIDVHLNHYYNLPFCMLMIITGCTALLWGARRIGRAPRILSFIGKNTLVFYAVHIYAISAVKLVLNKAGALPAKPWNAVVCLVPVCILCSAAALFINRFMPLLAGRFHPGKAKSA